MPLSQRLSRSAWSVLLDQALDGLRQGGVPTWPPGRWPRLRRRLERHWLGPIWGTLGDQVADNERWPAAVQLLLHWACGLVRPDHQAGLGLSQIPEKAWVEHTAWRPLLSVASTCGLLPIPDLPRHYRRAAGENALDTLCGLWAVGASSTYRYVEKGRRQIAEALIAAHRNADQRWILRDVSAAARLPAMSPKWHCENAQSLAQHGHSMDAAWHLLRGQHWGVLAELLRRQALDIASDTEHTALSNALRRATPDAGNKVALILGESVIWRCLGEAEAEHECLKLALRTSELVQADLKSLYIAESLKGFGYFYINREPEQSMGHLQAAAQQLLTASQQVPAGMQGLVQSAYVSTLALLAFVFLRCNNSQALTVLHSALSAAQESTQLSLEAQGMLLKAQSEAARCQDQLDDALRYRHQALVLYERAGDQREVIELSVNLGQLLAQAGRAAEAREVCEHVIAVSMTRRVRPEVLISSYVGLSLANMTLGNLEAAISHLIQVLRISQQFGLSRQQLTGLINLAEVHFLRFKQLGSIEDELAGDQYAEQARLLAGRLGLTQLETKAQSLKQATLNPQTAVHHLLPIETSAHPGEFTKIEALRAELALPRPPAQRARTHIALSQLYLRIAAKERDAARGLMQTHGLSDLESELEALQQTWAHDGNLASRLSQRWREQVGDWLTDAQRKAVLARLLEEGSLSKSSYGEAAEVSPATASKHLGLLADKGMLEQQGRGPATRYVLPKFADDKSTPLSSMH